MALLSSLHTRIVPHCPKVSTLFVQQALEDTAIDFFDRTRCYQSELPPQDIVPNQAEYTITPPDGYVLIEPYEVRVNKRFIDPTSEDALDLQWEELRKGYTYRLYHSSVFGGFDKENWRYAVATDPKFYYLSAKTGKLRLVGIPDTAYTGDAGLIVAAAWKPKIGVTEVPDSVFDTYYRALVDGALAQLFAIPDKPWTNPTLAAFRSAKYEAAVGEAEAAIRRNHQRDNRTVYRTVACP